MSHAEPDPEGYPRPIGPWPRREVPAEAIRLIGPEEFRTWILREDEHLLVLDKPGNIVCHPSKHGPRSSLVGAAREHLGGGEVQLIFRLDRETSGVVVITKDETAGQRLQKAVLKRRYAKTYLTILVGELTAETKVDQPLGPDLRGPLTVKTRVVAAGEGKPAITRFTPLAVGGGFTLARVTTATGRKHQIRAHAEWLGHPLVGDKIYGPDQRLFLEFIDTGWTPALAAQLLLPRQALHCEAIEFTLGETDHAYRTPLPADLAGFVRQHFGTGGPPFASP